MRKYEETRFHMINGFMLKAHTSESKALAIIKCEPTWIVDGKQMFLHETAPAYIETIEKVLEQHTKMKQGVLDTIEKINILLAGYRCSHEDYHNIVVEPLEIINELTNIKSLLKGEE